MKCVNCGHCIYIKKHKIECGYYKRMMDAKTEQPKWCREAHKTSELDPGIILDDDGM